MSIGVRPARRRGIVGVLALLMAGGCTGAVDSSDVGPDAPVAWAAGETAVTDHGPCALLSESEVERVLSATIVSSRVQASDALTEPFSFTLADQVCEYYGPRVVPSPAAGDRAGIERVPADGDRPPERGVDGILGALDTTTAATGQGLDTVRAMAEHIEAQLHALELSVSVHDEPLSREHFDTRYERRVEAFATDGAASESGALPADLRFVEQATDGAKDIGGVGDAARWYPAMAQLDVLVGDTAFTVSSPSQAPMIAGIVADAPVAAVDDPPQALVDIARLAAERL